VWSLHDRDALPLPLQKYSSARESFFEEIATFIKLLND
jgi:hypothetical protein